MRRSFAGVAALLAVATFGFGCSSTTSQDPSRAPDPAPAIVNQETGPRPEPQVGTGGELIAIQSDNVQAAGYDDRTQTIVLFRGPLGRPLRVLRRASDPLDRLRRGPAASMEHSRLPTASAGWRCVRADRLKSRRVSPGSLPTTAGTAACPITTVPSAALGGR